VCTHLLISLVVCLYVDSLEERAKKARCNFVCCLLYNTVVVFSATLFKTFDNTKTYFVQRKQKENKKALIPTDRVAFHTRF